MNQNTVLNRPPRDKTSTDSIGRRRSAKEVVEEFFAVTTTSVYLVSSKKDSEGTPIVEKIDQISDDLVLVGDRLRGGNLIGIMKSGITLYAETYSPRRRMLRPEEVDTAYWGERTPPIAALCLKRNDALMYLRLKELKNCDPRCRRETEETLERIGDNHPVFVLSRTEPIGFD